MAKTTHTSDRKVQCWLGSFYAMVEDPTNSQWEPWMGINGWDQKWYHPLPVGRLEAKELKRLEELGTCMPSLSFLASRNMETRLRKSILGPERQRQACGFEKKRRPCCWLVTWFSATNLLRTQKNWVTLWNIGLSTRLRWLNKAWISPPK